MDDKILYKTLSHNQIDFLKACLQSSSLCHPDRRVHPRSGGIPYL